MVTLRLVCTDWSSEWDAGMARKHQGAGPASPAVLVIGALSEKPFMQFSNFPQTDAARYTAGVILHAQGETELPE